MSQPWRGVIEEYRERLPVSDDTPVITLREGGTPMRCGERRERSRRRLADQPFAARPIARIAGRDRPRALDAGFPAGQRIEAAHVDRYP